MGLVRNMAEELRAVRERAAEADCAREDGGGAREKRDPAEALGNVAGRIAGLEGARRKAAGAAIAVLAVLLTAFTLATSGIGGCGAQGAGQAPAAAESGAGAQADG